MLPTLALLPLESEGQSLRRGALIRVHQGAGHSSRGVLLAMTSDSLAFRTAEGRTVVPLDLVTGLDVHGRESRGRSALRWTGRAFLAGAVVGAATCLVQTEDCKSSPDESNAGAIAGSAVFLGAGLAPIGAIVGALIPRDRWRQHRPPFDMTVAVLPSGSRVNVAFTLD